MGEYVQKPELASFGLKARLPAEKISSIDEQQSLTGRANPAATNLSAEINGMLRLADQFALTFAGKDVDHLARGVSDVQ